MYYVLSADRRLFVIKEFQYRSMLQASDVAEKVGRSLQNISYALDDLEEEKIVTCIGSTKTNMETIHSHRNRKAGAEWVKKPKSDMKFLAKRHGRLLVIYEASCVISHLASST